VDDCVGVANCCRYDLTVAHAAVHELDVQPGEVASPTSRQAVENGHRINASVGAKTRAEIATDEAGSARDQYPHVEEISSYQTMLPSVRLPA
jgi:hypothetical protein